MGATADPTADHVVALGNEISRAGEAEIGEGLAEAGDELAHVLAAAAGFMQRVLQQHVGRRELVDHLGVPGIAPELGEPAADDRLVFLFLGHDGCSSVLLAARP